MRALLDINVLLALLDREHIQHEQGRRWFQQEIHHGWASCAVTQNGFIRLLSQPGYPSPVTTARAMQLLATAPAAAHHGGRLATFDRTIALAAVRTAGPHNLVVL